MKFNVISIFPNQFTAFASEGVVGQACKKGLIEINLVNPRDFTSDNHRTVDDRPFGGGDGMIMLYEPLKKAIASLGDSSQRGPVVYLSPQGETLKQAWVETTASKLTVMTLICGRYGGIDQRLISELVDVEISIGDYVVSGGELPAMILMDAVARQIQGVLGHVDSAKLESFSAGLLEAPLFTRPRDIEGFQIPQVFLGGDHKKITELRLALSEVRTYFRRPDLLTKSQLDSVKKSAQILSDLTDAELKSCGVARESLVQI